MKLDSKSAYRKKLKKQRTEAARNYMDNIRADHEYYVKAALLELRSASKSRIHEKALELFNKASFGLWSPKTTQRALIRLIEAGLATYEGHTYTATAKLSQEAAYSVENYGLAVIQAAMDGFRRGSNEFDELVLRWGRFIVYSALESLRPVGAVERHESARQRLRWLERVIDSQVYNIAKSVYDVAGKKNLAGKDTLARALLLEMDKNSRQDLYEAFRRAHPEFCARVEELRKGYYVTPSKRSKRPGGTFSSKTPTELMESGKRL